MVTATKNIIEVDQREALRNPAMVFVEVKSIDGKNNYKLHALATDYSDTGFALHTYLPVPIGTQIEIIMGGSVAARGEVTNLTWDHYDEHNRIRLGVEFIEKNDNWIFQ